jgi:SAM-dependent methyltransferase
MLAAFDEALRRAPADVRHRVTLHEGTCEHVVDLLGRDAVDAVICHGVLMYVPDPRPVVAALAAVARPGGMLSLLARNQAGIAVRAGFRGHWAEALAALTGDAAYVNELGMPARADTVDGLSALVESCGFTPQAWYGIRALSDAATLDARGPEDAELDTLLTAEEIAARTDPYRQVAPLFQLIATR